MAAALNEVDNTVNSISKIVLLNVERSINTLVFMVVMMGDYLGGQVYSGTYGGGERYGGGCDHRQNVVFRF